MVMNSNNAYVETGKKKSFAGVIDWPGWCRSGGDDAAALQVLVDYGPRYSQILEGSELEFVAPTDPSDLIVAERHEGDSTTDFGAPGVVLDADRELMDGMELKRARAILEACWHAFDAAAGRAEGRELRKGPRGGGRDLEKMMDHVLEADRAYLRRLNWKHKREEDSDLIEELSGARQAIFEALRVAVDDGLPERGPRGGILWPPRYFVRRVAWHVLDHAWEIEDRVV
jgi:hypothetical protein